VPYTDKSPEEAPLGKETLIIFEFPLEASVAPGGKFQLYVVTPAISAIEYTKLDEDGLQTVIDPVITPGSPGIEPTTIFMASTAVMLQGLIECAVNVTVTVLPASPAPGIYVGVIEFKLDRTPVPL